MLVSHPFAKPDLDAAADHKQYMYHSLNPMVSVTANPSKMLAALAREVANISTFTKAVMLFCDKRGIKFEANSNSARAATQSKSTIVISSTVISQKTCAAQAFRMPVNIYYFGRSSAASLYEQTSQFRKRLDDIHQLSSSQPHQNSMVLCQRHAEINQFTNIQSGYGVLFSPQRAADQVISALGTFNSRFLKIRSQKNDNDLFKLKTHMHENSNPDQRLHQRTSTFSRYKTPEGAKLSLFASRDASAQERFRKKVLKAYDAVDEDVQCTKSWRIAYFATPHKDYNIAQNLRGRPRLPNNEKMTVPLGLRVEDVQDELQQL
ncbi:uncharacterized protein Triagg1_601 [Trichoderma aggressivum f. europaeum]|uniref:Uncharacterized protein n=1 Tax=Trichoderma aggressivum f. europaeum TaxID=173218 RepID=A0AAE1IKI3_9HYPO|nr:hypothetical protein Triagg1_601 [Trichoderma aggressivum f. europaeum]